MYYLEDIIEKAATEENFKLQIKKSDLDLFQSMHKQITKKKLSLTDRQYDLIIMKVDEYRDFLLEGLDDLSVSDLHLKYTIRTIDRTRYIKFNNDKIIVRFIFNKKLIDFIEHCKKWQILHNKKENIYTYKFTDASCFHIIDKAQNLNFEIDTQLLDRFVKLKTMYNQSEKYIPGIYNYTLKNLNDAAIEKYHNLLGEPCYENIHLYKDKAKKFGLETFTGINITTFNNKILNNIVNRTTKFVYITPNDSIQNVCEALNELNRNDTLITYDYNYVNDHTDVADSIQNEMIRFYKGTVRMQLSLQDDMKTDTILAVYPVTQRWFFSRYPNADLIICYNNSSFPILEQISYA